MMESCMSIVATAVLANVIGGVLMELANRVMDVAIACGVTLRIKQEKKVSDT